MRAGTRILNAPRLTDCTAPNIPNRDLWNAPNWLMHDFNVGVKVETRHLGNQKDKETALDLPEKACMGVKLGK